MTPNVWISYSIPWMSPFLSGYAMDILYRSNMNFSLSKLSCKNICNRKVHWTVGYRRLNSTWMYCRFLWLYRILYGEKPLIQWMIFSGYSRSYYWTHIQKSHSLDDVCFLGKSCYMLDVDYRFSFYIFHFFFQLSFFLPAIFLCSFCFQTLILLCFKVLSFWKAL